MSVAVTSEKRMQNLAEGRREAIDLKVSPPREPLCSFQHLFNFLFFFLFYFAKNVFVKHLCILKALTV